MPRRGAGRPEPRDGQRDLGPTADPDSVARTILLTKLTARPRSRHELGDALAARGVPDDVATRVLDRFEQVGLIDDAAFAEGWVRSRQVGRGLSRRVLAQELRRKGVDRDVVSHSVAAISADDERQAAHEVVVKKLPSLRRLDDDVRFRRLLAMLARRGYPPGRAVEVIRSALADRRVVDDGAEMLDRFDGSTYGGPHESP
ncbi:MAG: regulatory protein RecX [Nocardioidaceae bacterium]